MPKTHPTDTDEPNSVNELEIFISHIVSLEQLLQIISKTEGQNTLGPFLLILLNLSCMISTRLISNGSILNNNTKQTNQDNNPEDRHSCPESWVISDKDNWPLLIRTVIIRLEMCLPTRIYKSLN